MGACQSGDVQEAGGWNDSPDFNDDSNNRRVSVNKKTDEVEDFEPKDKPETDFFEFEAEDAAEDMQQFMAVKPWIGAVKEPTDHPEPNSSAPDETYELEYVYGYRCEDSRQNVFYNPDGNLVYMTACLGVILNKEENTQTFFGGGEVENKSKQVASDKHHHNNDIMCLNVNTSTGREWAATGQVGKSPSVFVWNTQTGEKKARFKLERNSRAVSAIALSPNAQWVATADRSNDHIVRVFDVNTGDIVLTDKGGPDPIFDMAFTKEEGKCVCWSAGVKHFAQWNQEKGKKEKGLFSGHDPTSFACVTADDRGRAYAGGANSLVYIFNGRSCQKTLGFHERGFIGAINWVDGKLYTGGKDGRVCIINTDSFECESAISFGVLPRALDVYNGKMIVGLRTGSIIECDMATQEMTTYIESHNDGEVWGLDQDADFVYTSGDDNQVKKWDPFARKCVDTADVHDVVRKARKNRASTLGKHPDSQSSRAVAVSPTGHVAVCGNDGAVTIRELSDYKTRFHEINDAAEWIEVAEYSPSGKYLAVGSHDTNIYIYNAEEGYALVGKCKQHNATITCIDWSLDECYIRSVCNAYELLFFNIPDCSQDKSGASNTTSTEWASQHCKFGWLVDGIFPKGTDGTHVNGVDMNAARTLIACGDDYGLVQIFRNPCRKGHAPKSLRGHSEHVVRVRFGRNNLEQFLFSVGGYDQTLMQWKLK